jgi:hypothetical protein
VLEVGDLSDVGLIPHELVDLLEYSADRLEFLHDVVYVTSRRRPLVGRWRRDRRLRVAGTTERRPGRFEVAHLAH